MACELLVTGFLPFAGDARNPSGEVAQAVEGRQVRGLRVRGAVLPVERKAASERLERLLAEERPRAVVALGQGSAPLVHVERVAVNLLDFQLPDQAGDQPRGTPISRGAPDALFSTLPVDELVAAVRAAGVPCEASLSAGSYLCNMVFFELLEAARATPRGTHRGVFVHLPPLPEVVAAAENERPSMALDTSLRAVDAILDATAALLG